MRATGKPTACSWPTTSTSSDAAQGASSHERANFAVGDLAFLADALRRRAHDVQDRGGLIRRFAVSVDVASPSPSR